ncbi:ABC transporter ATP-binding protein [Paenibacillus pabuli]|uniref:ABC transporter ATP-binding protein n=1 Tax=Paenibacillus pabuli TaxID=1472 RepID=UPI003CF7B5FA
MLQNVLEMRNVTKVYPNGVVANKNVNFSLTKGEIHALAGENGAGKSTLMKIIFGMEEPSKGEIFLRGEQIKLKSPLEAIDNGIGMVHQHFMLVPSFTVAENMVLGMEPKKGVVIDEKEAIRMTEELSKKYNLRVDPKAKVEDLSVGMKQKVEILKALIRGAEILILDEPTAVLTPQETEELFRELTMLKEQGHTIVFISHKLKEVKAICDRITIMRSGTTVGVFEMTNISEQEISRLMVGRDVVLKYVKDTKTTGEPVLTVNQLSVSNPAGKKLIHDIDLQINEGEIVGIAGVEGNGQSTFIQALTGTLQAHHTGSIQVKGDEISNKSIGEIRKMRVSYIPEDRMRQGAAKDESISDNMISTQYRQKEWNKGIFFNRKKIEDLCKTLVEEFKVKCSSPQQQIGMLSGGNMQKVIVSRECSTDPVLLIAEQPTRGVDVGAAQLIHHKLLEMRKNQCAILLISADLNEVLELSDRLLVMYEGEIVASFNEPSNLTEKELGLYMLGLKRDSHTASEGGNHG